MVDKEQKTTDDLIDKIFTWEHEGYVHLDDAVDLLEWYTKRVRQLRVTLARYE